MRNIYRNLSASICTFVLLTARTGQPVLPSDIARFAGSILPSSSVDILNEPSTPDLIEQAFVHKEINANQRLLYLAYAVYDYPALPKEYRSEVPWWGTEVVREIKDAAWRKSLDSSTASFVESELSRLLSSQVDKICDRITEGSHFINSTHFRVNYEIIGGGLSIDDYIDSLETAYATEITSYEWAAPPYIPSNTWNRYPVQVDDLGSSLYGYVTIGGGSYTGFVGDNPNTSQTETDGYASCMVLNSDFTGFPVGSLGSLQATAAHEFVHSIQFGIGDPPPWEDEIWWESIATYMEDEVYDDVNDNYQYLWPNFSACLGQYSGNVYANWLFFRYAAENNGGVNVAGGGEDVAQNFWINVSSQGQTGLQAYNSALGLKGSNLADVFHDYAIAVPFMQTCPAASPYCFEEAEGYLEEAGPIDLHGDIPSMPGIYNGIVLDNYGLNWIGLPASGPMTITLKSQTLSGELRGSVVAQTAGGLKVRSFPAVVGAGDLTTLVDYTPPEGTVKLIAVITNQLQTANDPTSCSGTSYSLSLYQHSIVSNYIKYFPLIIWAQ